MKRHPISPTSSLPAFVTAAVLALSACQTGRNAPANTTASPSAGSTPAPGTPRPRFFGGETGKSGTQLWSENCTRCHNDRSPASYSDAQWEVAMQHMRIRANLTVEEHRKILEFLQSAN